MRHLGERSLKVREEGREATEDDIKDRVSKRQPLGVHDLRRDVGQVATRYLGRKLGDHRRRQINADDLADWPHRRRKERGARPSCDIQGTLARVQRADLHQSFAKPGKECGADRIIRERGATDGIGLRTLL